MSRSLSVLMFGLLALLSGCGFHLQGRQPLPQALRVVYIDAVDAQSEFAQALRASLTASGAQVVAGASANVTTVHVGRDRNTERVLSVSARNIPTDYELSYEVTLDVRGQGRELMAPEELSLSRVYSFDERQLLAKDRERDELLVALARELAGVALRRLSSLQ
jgi:LPS-assembly lipoprotein